MMPEKPHRQLQMYLPSFSNAGPALDSSGVEEQLFMESGTLKSKQSSPLKPSSQRHWHIFVSALHAAAVLDMEQTSF
jgi:hypothetical protein